MWRSVFGARMGIGGGQVVKRTARKGTYTSANKNVLVAAEAAVLVHIAEKDGRMDRGFDELTCFGVKKSFFKSAIGDNAGAYDNVKTAKFEELTRKKKLQARVRHTASLHKWTAKRAGNVPETLGIIRRICYVGKRGELLPLASTDALIEELVGPKRCLRADLAVVGNLAFFYFSR